MNNNHLVFINKVRFKINKKLLNNVKLIYNRLKYLTIKLHFSNLIKNNLNNLIIMKFVAKIFKKKIKNKQIRFNFKLYYHLKIKKNKLFQIQKKTIKIKKRIMNI